MRILHVCKKYPPAMGGDAVVVASLQKEQAAAGHHVAIVTSNCDEIAAGPAVYKVGLRTTPAGLDKITPGRLLSLVTLALRLVGIVRRERPDIIHTHSADLALAASLAARLYGVPMVHTFHIVTFYDRQQSALRRLTELWLIKHARPRVITAPNTYDVQKLRAAGLKQTTLLPNGVDLTFWRRGDRLRHSAEFEFLSVGRLEPQKGYEYLIKATALLADATARPFRVTIVGDGSQGPALRELAQRLGVGDRLSLVGPKTPAEVRALLAQADVMVVPSLYETTPLTLLEAWAAGVATIVTPVGIMRTAPPDFEAAFVVPAKDAPALMIAMNHCLTAPPLRLRVAARGQAEAKQYAWPRIAQLAETIYRGAQ
ncbi:MAG TPA: glycosyltransferase family 4 protein [Candidatus Saccharimonadia bacterium]|nr:glycosyltransferase family 4 protein [Candidatus Saccharimonadia bacterium]